MKVLVAGDTLLDCYIEGEVSRISPEAPIPVLDQVSERFVLGGAANVAANIRTLTNKDLEIHYYGFFSRETTPLFKEYNIQLIGHYIPSSEILRKTRFASNNHQLLRLDNRKKYDDQYIEEIDKFKFDFTQYDLIVVIDYHKGTLDNGCFLNDLSYSNVPVLIEDKKNFLFGLGKNTIFKCNDKEYFRRVVSDYTMLEKSYKELIITHGSKGYSLINANKKFPATNKEGNVVDVCGAGDSFMAGLAANYLETGNFDPEAMAAFGNIVAGEKVKHFGTVAIEREWIDGQ